MRDIREDLRDRIVSLELEQSALLKRLQMVENRLRLFHQVIQEEDERWRPDDRNQPSLGFQEQQTIERAKAQYSGFLRDILSDGKPWSLEELKLMAIEKGIQFEGKNPGRVLHFALLGLAQNGVVEPQERGVWKMRALAMTAAS